MPATDGSGNPEDPIKETQTVALVDIDGDGDTDAVFGNADGTDHVLQRRRHIQALRACVPAPAVGSAIHASTRGAPAASC